MANRIQYRRDTAANWTAANPVLAAGEPGWETDTKKRKVGDGTTAWTGLAYQLDKAAADAAYSASYPLTGVTGTKRYDGLHGIYNATAPKLQKVRAKLAQAAVGAGTCRVLCAGDSITEGVGATGKPDVSSYPTYLRSLLVGRGYTSAGTGWVPPRNNNTGNTDSRWNIVSGFAVFGGATTYNNFVMSTTTNGANAIFTSDVAGDTVDIAYLDSSAYGAFTYSIDNASSGLGFGTITPSSATPRVFKLTVSGLSNATHTVKITTTSTTQSFLGPVQVRNSAGGLLLSNLGVGSSQTDTWASTASYYHNGPYAAAIDTYDLVIVEPMIVNDAVVGLGSSATLTNLTNIVTTFQATGADVVMLCPGTPNPAGTISAATWTPYRQAVYTVADSLNVPVLEPADRWGAWATAQANGLMNDQYHPTSAGYRDIASGLLRLISPAG